MTSARSTPLRRVKLVLIELPLVLLLMLCDAPAAAWDELSDDWRAFKHWIVESWRAA